MVTVAVPGGGAWRVGGFACCADVRLRSCCNPDTALTVGDLRGCWAEVDDKSPILVACNGFQADWAQRADVIAAGGGLVVARLFAPWAKQVQLAPGTARAPATTISETKRANEPGGLSHHEQNRNRAHRHNNRCPASKTALRPVPVYRLTRPRSSRRVRVPSPQWTPWSHPE
jgi:hypothetical protein